MRYVDRDKVAPEGLFEFGNFESRQLGRFETNFDRIQRIFELSRSAQEQTRVKQHTYAKLRNLPRHESPFNDALEKLFGDKCAFCEQAQKPPLQTLLYRFRERLKMRRFLSLST